MREDRRHGSAYKRTPEKERERRAFSLIHVIRGSETDVHTHS